MVKARIYDANGPRHHLVSGRDAASHLGMILLGPPSRPATFLRLRDAFPPCGGPRPRRKPAVKSATAVARPRGTHLACPSPSRPRSARLATTMAAEAEFQVGWEILHSVIPQDARARTRHKGNGTEASNATGPTCADRFGGQPQDLSRCRRAPRRPRRLGAPLVPKGPPCPHASVPDISPRQRAARPPCA